MWPQFADTLTLRRYTTQTISATTGLPVAQTPTTSSILVSWQPDDDESYPTAPGYTAPESRAAWVWSEVLTADEDTPRPADEIVDTDGRVWRVVSADPWRALAPLPPHWRIRCELVQPLRPATS